MKRTLKNSWGWLYPVARLITPWLCFWALFAWGWRVPNIFTYITDYGDALVVLWSIQWYHDSILVQHGMSLFTPLVFHPLGWHIATLGYTPPFFMLALPFYQIGGVAFAYNVLAILSRIISFAGCFRFVRLFASPSVATIAALIYTFVGSHWFRIASHLTVAWVFSVLPWLALAIEGVQRSNTPHRERQWVIIAGLVWGLAINIILYGVFLGALVFSLWGRQLLSMKRLRQAVLAAIVAAIVALPTIVPCVLGTYRDRTHTYGIEHNLWWGASLNSLFIPSVFHPLAAFRQISQALYSGPYNESGVINLGLSTGLLVLSGFIIAVRTRPRPMGLIWLTLTCLVLGLGLLLRWNGEIVHYPFLRPLTALVWELGHALKPGLFTTPQPAPVFEGGIPLPGLVLTAVIPFWESARTLSRFAFVGMLGMVALAAIALERFPKLLRYMVALIWLVEALPRPIYGMPVPLQPHPAYAWLADQELESGEGIVDLVYSTPFISGETIWATLFHRKPTASGAGSAWPEHTFALWNYLLSNPQALSQEQSALIFRQYGIRYIFLHVLSDKERAMWDMISKNSSFRPLACFEPLKGPTAWPWSICVAEVNQRESSTNVLFVKGWSGREEWGTWAEGLVSKAGWISLSNEAQRLRIGAFPLCVPDQRQQMIIKVNGREIDRYQWRECEFWEGEITIPGSLIKIGWNEVSFEYAYALSPAEVTNGANLDRRLLSVGFTKVEIMR